MQTWSRFCGSGPEPAERSLSFEPGAGKSPSKRRAEERPLGDVAVASLFSLDAPLPGADEALARDLPVTATDASVPTWIDEPDLHRKLVELLRGDPELGLKSTARRNLSLVRRRVRRRWPSEGSRGGGRVPEPKRGSC